MQNITKKKKAIFIAIFALILLIAGILLWVFVINNYVVPGKQGHYTCRYADEQPDSFSPLTWTTDGERSVLSYTTSSLYVTASDEEGNVVFTPELATALPQDVTEEYAGDTVYGVPEDAQEGYAYRITIRDDAVWEDGTAITTADFAYALQLYLSENSTHQSDYENSYAALANVAAYLQDSYTCAYDAEAGYADVSDEELYFSLTQVNALLKTTSLEEYYAYYFQDKATLFIDDTNGNIYEQLEELAGGEDYVLLSDESRALLAAFCKNYGIDDEEGYKRLCFYQDEDQACTWEEVGFVAEDDTTMTFILEKEVDACELAYALSDLLLVKQDVYEANPDAYGCSAESYQSYGPYTIVSFDEEEMVLEKNEAWFGYSDEAYEGQYQTTDIEIVYGLSEEEELARFTEGNLDVLNLSENADAKSWESSYAYSIPDSATDMLCINMDVSSLTEKNEAGENHTLLAYKDFRQALSLAIDRAAYIESLGVTGEPAYGLMNAAYIVDISTMLSYRETSDAQDILSSIYGEPDESGEYTCYDMEKAARLLESAYDACMMDGNIRGNDKIVIDFYSEHAKAAELLQSILDTAAEGTSLEGRITVRSVNRMEDADIYECKLNGSEWDPYAFMQNYLDSAYAAEDGFALGILKCSVSLNDESISMTYRQWYQELMHGSYRSASSETQIKILAYLEKGLLTSYKTIPLYVSTETCLHSQRIASGTEESTAVWTGYETLRNITYTMDDKEWSRYCRKQKNALIYD